MDPVRSEEQQEHEALLDFIYLCPMAITQLDGQGNVEMMNPLGAQILMQLVATPVVENLFDALAPSFTEVTLRRDPACPVCGESPTITEYVDYVEFCQGRPAEVH